MKTRLILAGVSWLWISTIFLPIAGLGQTNAPYTFTTLAGLAGNAGSADGIGSAARFSSPSGVVVDNAGNVYVADTWTHTIRKIGLGGVVTTVAGLAGNRGSADGIGSTARFSDPTGVAVDNSGNVYVADSGNNTVRKIGPNGAVTTLAGSAGTSGSADGIGSAARFSSSLWGMAVEGMGNVYVADGGNHMIRKIGPGGVVTTVAPVSCFGVTVDGAGNVYGTDKGNNTIIKIGPGGLVTAVAGYAPGAPGYNDGTGVAARFNQPQGVAVDGTGNVYVADCGNSTIRMIGPGGVVTTLAGLAGMAGSTDGTGNTARFNQPWGVAVDGAGNVYVADGGNHTIRVSVNTPVITGQPQSQTVIAGTAVTFSVTASGIVLLSYQWRKDGINIGGATNSNDTVNNVQVSHAGAYSVVVSNIVGSVISLPATLIVKPTQTGSNQVLSLDGNGAYVMVPDQDDLDLSTNFTLEAWINASSVTAETQGIIAKRQSDVGGTYRLGLIYDSPSIGVNDQVWPQPGQNIVMGSPNGITQGTWHHICATYDGVLIRFYVDGDLKATTAASIKLPKSNMPLFLGKEGLVGDERYFFGLLDEARIWNKARAQEEIKRDMTHRLAGTEPNLVAYWNFDDGTAKDLTGHGHNGTFMGNAKVVPTELSVPLLSPVIIQRTLTLNGTGDYVTIPSASDLQPSNQVTIEAWIYPIANSNNPNAYFISKGADSNLDSSRTYELTWTPDNRAYFSLFTGQSTWSLLGAPVAESQWTHVALTYDGSNGLFALYTNGVMAASTGKDVTGQFSLKGQLLRQTGAPLIFGCSFNGAAVPGTFATGQMDEVRIWNRALSGQEILLNMGRKLSGNETNLVAYWNFDNGTANDSTGNSHNGTLASYTVISPVAGFDILHNVIGFAGTTFDRRGEIMLSVTARNGVNIRIDASTNLVNWLPVTTIQNNQGTIQFIDPDTLKFTQRFYRAVLP